MDTNATICRCEVCRRPGTIISRENQGGVAGWCFDCAQRYAEARDRHNRECAAKIDAEWAS